MKALLKRFAWFVVKSPQRKMVGYRTLMVDLIGMVQIAINLIFKKNTNATIWICTGNYNRSEALLKYLISSMSKLNKKHRFGLSVVDCNSTDIENLEEKIREIWSGPFVYSTFHTEFSRAAVFNQAIEQATGDWVFVCDADISLPQNLIAEIQKYVNSKTAWFPVCQWQNNPESRDWKWFSAGTGIFAASKQQLSLIGLYNTRYKSWGHEDWDLFFRFYFAHIMPVRTRCSGLYHHWHTPSKPENFKKMF